MVCSFYNFLYQSYKIFLGQLGAQSSTILIISNSSDTNMSFKVKVTHPTRYSVIPSAGTVEPSECQKIQITLKELSHDCEKDKFMILSAVQNISVDAPTFWRIIKPGNYTSKKLTVQIISNEKQFQSNNEYALKQQTFNKQQLELHIRRAVQNGQSLSAIEKQLFSNSNAVPKAVKQFVTKEYTEYLIEVLKHNFKNAVLNMVKHG